MQFWPMIQLSTTMKGRTKRAICMLDPIVTLIARLILSLQVTVTTVVCSAAFPMIGSRIRLMKVVETVLLAITLLMLLTINPEQKVTNTVENLRIIIVPQIINLGFLILLSSFSVFKSCISYSWFAPLSDIAATPAPICAILWRDISCLTWKDLCLGALWLRVLHISACDFN